MARNKLIEVRKGMKKTQADIAKLCSVEQQTYSHWETGRSTPPPKKMVILERIFNVPKEELFSDVFNSDFEYSESSTA